MRTDKQTCRHGDDKERILQLLAAKARKGEMKIRRGSSRKSTEQ
jgi:hypothetical protein